LGNLISNPVRKGIIPIIPPLAMSGSCQLDVIPADDIVLALIRQFQTKDIKSGQSTTSVDRIIFLDHTGGIPDPLDGKRMQIFVNLEQDYDIISSKLSEISGSRLQASLNCLKECLGLLPDSASALLATPEEVAESTTSNGQYPLGVGTRRRRNRLIHNILTNKPIVSSSLPLGRLQSSASSSRYTSTFFKRGMPLRIVPDPSNTPWTGPLISGQYLSLSTDPRINLPNLVSLMEDSFARALNVPHYLARINQHLAGIIIAGDYEGGAILTWEDPPGRPGRPPVPYLDKFAVRRRSQGSGGVADIVFNAMVRNCFPNGVVWRSRRDNPVNKWYFERATGTWEVPGTNWTMFWTGSNIDFKRVQQSGNIDNEVAERWKDYVAVCGNILPSWADNTKPPD
jgi:amino-acid N-acetyltransferase